MTTGHQVTQRVTAAQGLSVGLFIVDSICMHFRVYTKEKPLNVTYGIGLLKDYNLPHFCLLLFFFISFLKGIAEHDAEGRAITLEFKKYFFVVTCKSFWLFVLCC